ncbi:MAG: SRPBCC family protein [Balneolaceae bacterium]|nr:SRPBCC family protein [Balneolaceae bacterium]MBO6544905.1 SRPBCC family protein [Balneolaceae bacterium]MBO6646301.1 SRPBCC family protein [Balneolaceae bacterium]
MNYTLETTINKPLDEVIAFFEAPSNYPLWMEGLKEHQTTKGSHGQEGAESRFVFDMKGREMEMTETVLVSNLPEKYTVQYKAPGMTNKVELRYSEIDANTTKVVSYNEFQFSGFMKIISFFMGGAFKKQSHKYLDDFKSAVEKE